ncbi:MAG: hypothetical protein NTX26_01455 [Candidatus Parcubacteria bacterium]|nr:hypothetical protein [Candidatus Parcubacteria bacterium]
MYVFKNHPSGWFFGACPEHFGGTQYKLAEGLVLSLSKELVVSQPNHGFCFALLFAIVKRSFSMKKITSIFLTILFITVFSSQIARAETLNQLSDFYVNQEYDLTGRSKLTAVLKVITDKFYIYFDKTWLESLDISLFYLIISKIKIIPILSKLLDPSLSNMPILLTPD